MSLRAFTFALALGGAALAGPPAAAGNEAVLGSWSCVAQSSEGELGSTWLIREDAGTLVVDVEIEMTKQRAQEVRLEGQKLSMKVSYQTVPYDVVVTFDRDAFEGTWSGNGATGPLRGKRATAP
jgi:hypothetical protein